MHWMGTADRWDSVPDFATDSLRLRPMEVGQNWYMPLAPHHPHTRPGHRTLNKSSTLRHQIPISQVRFIVLPFFTKVCADTQQSGPSRCYCSISDLLLMTVITTIGYVSHPSWCGVLASAGETLLTRIHDSFRRSLSLEVDKDHFFYLNPFVPSPNSAPRKEARTDDDSLNFLSSLIGTKRVWVIT